MLMDCIGRGQYGEVFKAVSKTHGNFVAVKRIPQRKDAIASVQNEVELLKNLNHPSLFPILSVNLLSLFV